MANDIAVVVAVVAVFVAATVGSAGGTAALLSDQESVTVPVSADVAPPVQTAEDANETGLSTEAFSPASAAGGAPASAREEPSGDDNGGDTDAPTVESGSNDGTAPDG